MNAMLGRPLELDEIIETHDMVYTSFFSARVPMKSRLKKVVFMSNGVFWFLFIYFKLLGYR